MHLKVHCMCQYQQDSLCTFSLLRLTASTCFKHLLAHNQEVLYVQQLVYFMCYVGWLFAVVVYTVPPDDEQNKCSKTCRG
jgi:hypothetical protein